jgi:uncharacterized protein (DUF736 family)
MSGSHTEGHRGRTTLRTVMRKDIAAGAVRRRRAAVPELSSLRRPEARCIMPMIGTFTPAKDGGWTGSIHTLTINAKLRFVPNDNRDNERAPVFRVFVGDFCIGNAWEARSCGESPKNYLRVKLDDPNLIEPISAALFPSEDGGTAQLVWKRRRVDGAEP